MPSLASKTWVLCRVDVSAHKGGELNSPPKIDGLTESDFIMAAKLRKALSRIEL
jgi:hypothetical protein